MKYKYLYDKSTRMYKVIRNGIDTPWFSSLRACKQSWKFICRLHNAKYYVEDGCLKMEI